MPRRQPTFDMKVQVDAIFTTKADESPLVTKDGEPYIRVKVYPGLGERHDGVCSVFDENFFETFKKDEWYHITYTHTGNFYNIVDAVPCKPETYDKHDAREKEEPPSAPPPVNVRDEVRNKSINIQSARRDASHVVSALVGAKVMVDREDIDVWMRELTEENFKIHKELMEDE